MTSKKRILKPLKSRKAIKPAEAGKVRGGMKGNLGMKQKSINPANF